MAIPAKWAALAAEIEAAIEPYLPDLATRQAAYLAARGRYWQGIDADVPVDGSRRDRDIARRPHDQNESWADFGWTLPRDLTAAVTVDVYAGRAGKGYTVSVTVELDRRLWRKTYSGAADPESRPAPWMDVTPEAPGAREVRA